MSEARRRWLQQSGQAIALQVPWAHARPMAKASKWWWLAAGGAGERFRIQNAQVIGQGTAWQAALVPQVNERTPERWRMRGPRRCCTRPSGSVHQSSSKRDARGRPARRSGGQRQRGAGGTKGRRARRRKRCCFTRRGSRHQGATGATRVWPSNLCRSAMAPSSHASSLIVVLLSMGRLVALAGMLAIDGNRREPDHQPFRGAG